MTRIAILSCNNVKNELCCSASVCFRSFNEKTGTFERYKEKEALLVGFSTCAGCPTLLAPRKILKKIKPLVEISKAEKIHFSTCMVKICPFVNTYKNIINEAYPHVEVIMGTELSPDQLIEVMKTTITKLLTDPNPDISEEIMKFMPLKLF